MPKSSGILSIPEMIMFKETAVQLKSIPVRLSALHYSGDVSSDEHCLPANTGSNMFC